MCAETGVAGGPAEIAGVAGVGTADVDDTSPPAGPPPLTRTSPPAPTWPGAPQTPAWAIGARWSRVSASSSPPRCPSRPLPARAARPALTLTAPLILKEVGSVPNHARRAWRLCSLDRATGRVLWERTAHEGMPKVKRHSKASQASATARDGARGRDDGLGRALRLRRDRQAAYGPRTSDASTSATSTTRTRMEPRQFAGRSTTAWQWSRTIATPTPTSSAGHPHRTGAVAGRPRRDAVVGDAARAPRAPTTVVTNSPKAIRGHDATTSKELWQVADGTQVKVPTPVAFEDLVIVIGRLANRGPANLRGMSGRRWRGGVEARTRGAGHDHAARL